VRELTGGIYFGDRKEDDGDGTAYDVEPYSRPEIERVTRLAAQLALAEDPPAPVWSLDKANVLATSRLWRNVFTQVMEKEYPQLKFGHHLIDSAAMLMVKNPRALNGIIVTSNLFGDIISDEASVIPGSLGLLPSASLSGIYEPIHGMYSLKLFRKPSVLIAISFRLSARHRRSRYRQPSRHRSLYEHDVEIFLLLARTCKEDRRGRQDYH
jgi:isocitrate/isopropylmalate dehydrogenase